MILRTFGMLAALYVWGDPRLDDIRPKEITFLSQAVREAFSPVVENLHVQVLQHVPDQVKYAQFNNPMIVVADRFGRI